MPSFHSSPNKTGYDANPVPSPIGSQGPPATADIFEWSLIMRFFALLLPVLSLFAQKPEWDDPAVIHVGTERPHATMMTYPSADLAKAGERSASPWFKLLNGNWK